MQIYAGRVHFGKKNLMPIFFIGIVSGILILNLGKSTLLEGTGLFDEYTLYGMKSMTVDRGALFCYVFRRRMLALLIMAITATTYLGYAACIGVAGWCGMAAGTFLSALTIRYGIKGVILAVVSVFPQMLFYLPAIIMMLGWGEDIYRAIYSKGTLPDGTDRVFWMKKLGRLGLIALITVLGCMMEGYVNPGLLLGYLKGF